MGKRNEEFPTYAAVPSLVALLGRQIGVGFGGRRPFTVIRQGDQHAGLSDSASAPVQCIVSEKSAHCRAGKDVCAKMIIL